MQGDHPVLPRMILVTGAETLFKFGLMVDRILAIQPPEKGEGDKHPSIKSLILYDRPVKMTDGSYVRTQPGRYNVLETAEEIANLINYPITRIGVSA